MEVAGPLGTPLGLAQRKRLATPGEDWASQGQPKGKAEIPVVTRESRRRKSLGNSNVSGPYFFIGPTLAPQLQKNHETPPTSRFGKGNGRLFKKMLMYLAMLGGGS